MLINLRITLQARMHHYILQLSATMGLMLVLMCFFWTRTGVSSTNSVIYKSVDSICSVLRA